ncbi:alpha-1,2-fucosyltransferase [Alteraurantiacibacter buctensis]|uniref:Uncharacterized protein n=1 Tax=Alteraurantiacibacter buctensis TaxID=1503981 RepID=A0A844YW31_9SPHN|nr:alpha-1,2-fucosyltransferase [Alteraurantiacibacter buctensis]MXO72545.1 hypothetical protein [Alteraurantiacibacter buctensis]
MRYLLFVLRMVLVVAIDTEAGAVRRVAGRQVSHHRYRRLLAQHWPHLLRLRPVRQVTVGDFAPRAGAGSRALMTIYAIAWCRRHGYRYRHTPKTRVAHADRAAGDYDAAWERELDLGAGEVPVGRKADPAVFGLWELLLDDAAPGLSLLEVAGLPLAGEFAPYYTFIDRAATEAERDRQAAAFLALMKDVLPEVRARYRSREAATATSGLTVAVHVRRGDVSTDRPDMWTDGEAFARALEQVLGELAARGIRPQVHVYSQGEPEDLAALAPLADAITCDGNPIATFRALVQADVLVMSKSCFSHLAALLSEGIVIYEPWRVPPQPGWVVRGADGMFDRAGLAARLTGPRP